MKTVLKLQGLDGRGFKRSLVFKAREYIKLSSVHLSESLRPEIIKLLILCKLSTCLLRDL